MFATSYSQTINDTLVTNFNYSENIDFQKFNSLKTDWNSINSPLLFYPIIPTSTPLSLHSLYTEAYLNSGNNFTLTPDIMLSQFQLVNNWSTKKKYGVFTKYLGIAQFVSVLGLAAVHISKYHMPQKTKNNLKTNNLIEPKNK
jgi:hypothetical protein